LFALDRDPLAVADDDEPFFEVFGFRVERCAGGPGAFDDDFRAIIGVQCEFKGGAVIAVGFSWRLMALKIRSGLAPYRQRLIASMNEVLPAPFMPPMRKMLLPSWLAERGFQWSSGRICSLQ